MPIHSPTGRIATDQRKKSTTLPTAALTTAAAAAAADVLAFNAILQSFCITTYTNEPQLVSDIIAAGYLLVL